MGVLGDFSIEMRVCGFSVVGRVGREAHPDEAPGPSASRR
jgi:hypothetical protein